MISQASGVSPYSEKTLFTLILMSIGENKWQVSSSQVEGVKVEAAATSKDKIWSSLIHVMALATVITVIGQFFQFPPMTLNAWFGASSSVCSHWCFSNTHFVVKRWQSWQLPRCSISAQSFCSLVCRGATEMPLTTKSTQGENVRQITQFFSRKPNLSSKMKVGTKRLATNEQGVWVEVQKRPCTASTHTRKYNPNR